MDLSNITSIIGRQSPASRGRPPIASPARDWHLVLVASGIALVLLAVFAAAVFWEESGYSAAPSPSSSSSALSAEKLNALLAAYRALDAEHAALLSTSTPAIADPSQPK